MRPKSLPANMTVGWRFRARRGEHIDEYTDTQEYSVPTAKPQPAQVGLSLSRGASEDYGRNKLEVAVWVTAPSGDAPAEVQQTWDTLHQLALEELDSRWNQTFDHIFGEDGES